MKTGYLYVNDLVFPTKLAVSESEQQKGLMFEKYPEVMSFVYTSPKVNKFWMKNTPAALDIVFANENKVLFIKKGEPFSLSSIGEDELSDLVVEFPYGTMNSHGIKPGDKLGLFMPSLAEIMSHGFRR